MYVCVCLLLSQYGTHTTASMEFMYVCVHVCVCVCVCLSVSVCLCAVCVLCVCLAVCVCVCVCCVCMCLLIFPCRTHYYSVNSVIDTFITAIKQYKPLHTVVSNKTSTAAALLFVTYYAQVFYTDIVAYMQGKYWFILSIYQHCCH